MSASLLRAASCALLLGASVCCAQQSAAKNSPIAFTGHAPSMHDRREAEKAYLAGAHAIENKDLRSAYNAFTEAATLDPGNEDYRNAAAIAKAHFVSDLIQQADKSSIIGNRDVARARIAEAFSIDPKNPMVLQHTGDLEVTNVDDTPSSAITSQIQDAIRLEPLNERHSFHLRADGQSLLRQVLNAYAITPSFDASVTSQAVRFDADDVTFEQAAQLLRLDTDSFFVPLDPHRVLVAKDTRENRIKYERLLVETIYLPGMTQQEMTDMGNLARNVLDIQQASVQPSSGRLTVRGPAERIAVLNRTIEELLDGRSEVLLDMKIFEIARTRTLDLGVQPPQQFSAFNLNTELQSVLNGNQALISQIVSSGLANANDLTAIAAILLASGQISNSILSQPFVTFGGGLTATGLTLGTTAFNLALNTSDSRAIDQLQLRVEDQEPGNILAGLRYPIVQSSYSNLTTAGVNIPGLNSAGLSSQLTALGLNTTALNQQTIPQVQYQDLGLALKATPHIHRDQSVALKLDLKVQALGGTSLNQIPIITNRQFTADLDLKNGESALVSSDLTTSEALAISGLPGLSEIPGLASATSNRNVQRTTDELVVLITPHVVRLSHAAGVSPVMLVPVHQ